MPRYIDADALKAKYEQMIPEIGDGYHKETLQDVLYELEHAPTVSPDEVRGAGNWIVKQTAIGKEYTICSVCKTDFKFKTDKGTLARLDMRGMSYCPNCGAKMEVSDDA